MKNILDLINPTNSIIKYQIQKFPDGQQNIVIKGYWVHHQETRINSGESELHEVGSTIFNNHIGNSIQIKSRLNNWLDLELIVCAIASLRELGVEEIHLYVPCFMGARSDRKFEDGGNNYLKDVLAPVINSLNFKTVTCIDPHSDVLEACIKGFRKESNIQLIDFAHRDIVKSNSSINPFILVSPDAGASKKIYKLVEQIGYKGDIITCSKDRDTEGKLTKTTIPWEERYFGKDLIIIDDICDGGATFINIARELRKLTEDFTPPKIYLIITHGIFSRGFAELSKYFDGIYCTNSYKNIGETEYHAFQNIKTNVKQLNVF